MGRKRKRNGTPRAATQPQQLQESQYLSGYDGANQSLRRGDVFLDLDTRRELDSFSRGELMRRVRWLYINVGFVRGIVRNGATLVGWLTPQFKTKSKEWNKLAETRLKLRTARAKNFDRSGKFTYRTAQKMIQRAAKKDGDILTVLTTNEEGTAPAVQFYEAHQLCNPKETKGKRWVDGVQLSPRSDRHIAYGLRDEKGEVKVIPASSVIYFGGFDSPGHVRAISPLAHAVNHAIDITEIRADAKHAIKTSGLEALIRTRDKEVRPNKSSQGMPGILKSRSYDTPEGKKTYQSREVWAGGQIPELEPGEDLKLLTDTRPHPNIMEFQDELYRDIASGYGTDLEAIYKLGKMTGPGVRFLMDKLSRWIADEQDAVAEWCMMVNFYFLAWDLTKGFIPFPPDGEDWMTMELLPQRDLTIDRGKDGRQMMESLDRGMGTLARWHAAMSGADWEDEVAQRIHEVKEAKKMCEAAKIPYEMVFPPRAGAAIADTTPPSKDEEEEDEPPEEDEEP